MTLLDQQKRLLSAHGIKYGVYDGQLIAESEGVLDGQVYKTEDDLTGMSLAGILLWLGY